MIAQKTGYLFFIHHDPFAGFKMVKIAEHEIVIQGIELTVKVLEVF